MFGFISSTKRNYKLIPLKQPQRHTYTDKKQPTSNLPSFETFSHQDLKKQLLEALPTFFNQKISDARDKKIRVPIIQQLINLTFSKELNHESKTLLTSWLGQMYFQVVSASFHLFSEKILTFEEAKIHCCESILNNLINLIGKIQIHTKGQFGTFLNTQSEKIFGYLCNKYPQTNFGNANQKLRSAIKPINNLGSYQYDMLRTSGIKLKYRENGDYTIEIMKVLNYIILLPSKKFQFIQKQQFTYAEFFNKYFTDLFRSIEEISKSDSYRLSVLELQKVIQEHRQKVRSFTHFLIGRKISEDVSLFTDDQINSGLLNVQSPGILRIMAKWLQSLMEYFDDPQRMILQKTERFKGADGSGKKLSTKLKKALYNQALILKDYLMKKIALLKQQCFGLQEQTMKKFYQLNDLSFLSSEQLKVNEFACKMEKAICQYLTMCLNKTIHTLLKLVNKVKDQVNVSKGNILNLQKDSPDAERIINSLQINLIQFKIGDILRCKCSSQEKYILQIFQKFKTDCQRQNFPIQIIRIKDRLNMGTRDILINIILDRTIICQVQLAIQTQFNQKQSYYDKFNHFLYELKRAQFGPICQMASIWKNNDQRSLSMIKAIQKFQAKRITNLSKYKLHKCKEQSLNEFKFPFICHLCDILITNNYHVLRNWCCQSCNTFYCGFCLEKCYNEKKKIEIIFGTNVNKISKYLYEFNYKDQNQQLQIGFPTFGILIPKYQPQKSFNFFKLVERKKVDDEDQSQYFLVQSKYNNSFNLLKQIQPTTKYFFQVKQNLIHHTLQKIQKYFIYYFKDSNKKQLQLKLISQISSIRQISLMFLKEKYQQKRNQYLQKIQEMKDKFQVIYLSQEKQDIFFPFYDPKQLDKNIEIRSAQKEIMNIISKQQQVANITSSLFFQQIQKVKHDKSLLKVKQMYSSSTLFTIQSLSVLSAFKNLQILQINNARLTKMSFLEPLINLIDLSLEENMLTEIQGLQFQSKLKHLNLYGNQLKIMKGLQNLINLEQLQLDQNDIVILEGLDNLTKLNKISLYQNSIKLIQNLTNLKEIAHLSLARNQIQKIQGLQTLYKLKHLSLSGNVIKRIQNLSKNKNIQIIQLYQNKLNDIDPNIKQLNKLKLLNIKGNHGIMQNIQIKKTINVLKSKGVEILMESKKQVESSDQEQQQGIDLQVFENNNIQSYQQSQGKQQNLNQQKSQKISFDDMFQSFSNKEIKRQDMYYEDQIARSFHKFKI